MGPVLVINCYVVTRGFSNLGRKSSELSLYLPNWLLMQNDLCCDYFRFVIDWVPTSINNISAQRSSGFRKARILSRRRVKIEKKNIFGSYCDDVSAKNTFDLIYGVQSLDFIIL